MREDGVLASFITPCGLMMPSKKDGGDGIITREEEEEEEVIILQWCTLGNRYSVQINGYTIHSKG